MGIQGLTRLIGDNAPEAIKGDGKIENYHGRKIAIDASMAIYQFLIAVRQAPLPLAAAGAAAARAPRRAPTRSAPPRSALSPPAPPRPARRRAARASSPTRRAR